MPRITTFKFKSLVMILVFLSSCIAYAGDGDQIDKNEKVIFFPSYGYFDSYKSKWALIVQGIIFQPSTSSFKRQLVRSGFEAYTGSEISNRENFWERVQPLVSDNERDEKVKIRLGGKTYTMPESSNGGRFTEEIMLSDNEVRRLMDSNGWIHYTATSQDNRAFLGKVQLTGPNGVSVISDVDDTIKVTEVYKDKKTMLINTFNRPMKAAPGMSAFYRELNGSDVRFHYVSGSPRQLYPVLEGFRVDNGFPAGSFDMKEFRANPGSPEFWDFLASGTTRELKKNVIEKIITSFPDRKFILIGDSGEQDPEIYGWAVRTYPDRVTDVYIRNVTDEEFGNQRMTNAFGASINRVRLIDMHNGSIVKFSGTLRPN